MAKLKIDKLIEYAYLREECDLPDVIIDEELEHPIYRAQEVLRMLMGDAFYQDYLTSFKNLPFTAAYSTVFSYIKQFLAWQAHEFWVVKANFKVHASGFRVHSEDNSTAPTDSQMATIIKDAKYQGNYYKKIMVDFLNNHAAVGTMAILSTSVLVVTLRLVPGENGTIITSCCSVPSGVAS